MGSTSSFRVESDGISVSSRGFEAGARTHWHTHSAQLLFVKEGQLRYQVHGGPVSEVGLHETVYLPRGVPHWHGALPGEGLTHVSVTFPNAAGERLAIEWREPVTHEQYESRQTLIELFARNARPTSHPPTQTNVTLSRHHPRALRRHRQDRRRRHGRGVSGQGHQARPGRRPVDPG